MRTLGVIFGTVGIVFAGIVALWLMVLFFTSLARANVHVVDGDTFELAGERIRISNIDAPETRDAKCDAERMLGAKATERLTQLLTKPHAITRKGRDRYGRTLAVITANGHDVGQTLVAEHLAVVWSGVRHCWCCYAAT